MAKFNAIDVNLSMHGSHWTRKGWDGIGPQFGILKIDREAGFVKIEITKEARADLCVPKT